MKVNCKSLQSSNVDCSSGWRSSAGDNAELRKGVAPHGVARERTVHRSMMDSSASVTV